jgi:hypothetical protein
MAESIVRVFPSPISSARIPPPVSTGFSDLSKPVIACLYLLELNYEAFQTRSVKLTRYHFELALISKGNTLLEQAHFLFAL